MPVTGATLVIESPVDLPWPQFLYLPMELFASKPQIGAYSYSSRCKIGGRFLVCPVTRDHKYFTDVKDILDRLRQAESDSRIYSKVHLCDQTGFWSFEGKHVRSDHPNERLANRLIRSQFIRQVGEQDVPKTIEYMHGGREYQWEHGVDLLGR